MLYLHGRRTKETLVYMMFSRTETVIAFYIQLYLCNTFRSLMGL